MRLRAPPASAASHRAPGRRGARSVQTRSDHYRLNKQAEHSIRLGEEQGEHGLDPISEVGTGKPRDPKMERLAEIIERLNELFGTGVDDRDQLRFADNLAERERGNLTAGG